MPTQAREPLLVLLLTLLFLGLMLKLSRFDVQSASPKDPRRLPRPLQPHTPDDCAHCKSAIVTSPAAPARVVVPYSQRKSQRGRKKHIDTHGQACPNPDCDYRTVMDPAAHALVEYGRHGIHDPIQDYYCQACHHKFSARRPTALYRLKTPPAHVAQALRAVAEGLSAEAAARVFRLSATTVRSWVARAGQHS